jgi:hypothetical protein
METVRASINNIGNYEHPLRCLIKKQKQAFYEWR